MTIGLIGAASSANVNFGTAYTGLATVGYKIVGADKSTLQDWTTSGVTEVESGSGIYMVSWSSTFFTTTVAAAVQVGKIHWRTASGGTLAADDLEIRYPAPSLRGAE